jgi:hypothetical protein
LYYSTVAQLVEQSAVNRSVAGSSPACGAIFYALLDAALAQLVERFHGKEEVAGSNPASGFLDMYDFLAGRLSSVGRATDL